MYNIGIDLGGTNIVASVVKEQAKHQQAHRAVQMKFLMILLQCAVKQWIRPALQ